MLNKLADFLFEPEENIEKKNMTWNIAGSFCYAFASILLSFLVMRIAGDVAESSRLDSAPSASRCLP